MLKRAADDASGRDGRRGPRLAQLPYRRRCGRCDHARAETVELERGRACPNRLPQAVTWSRHLAVLAEQVGDDGLAVLVGDAQPGVAGRRIVQHEVARANPARRDRLAYSELACRAYLPQRATHPAA